MYAVVNVYGLVIPLCWQICTYNGSFLLGITRDILHKRRLTGGKKAIWRKKRKYNLGRQPANTKLGPKAVRPVRVRGGNYKFRALRLDTGNYSWGSESVTRKTRIVAVVYNASNNELVRTNTLVKGCIVQIDATPFRQWYSQQYGIEIGKKKKVKLRFSWLPVSSYNFSRTKYNKRNRQNLKKRQQIRKNCRLLLDLSKKHCWTSFQQESC